ARHACRRRDGSRTVRNSTPFQFQRETKSLCPICGHANGSKLKGRSLPAAQPKPGSVLAQEGVVVRVHRLVELLSGSAALTRFGSAAAERWLCVSPHFFLAQRDRNPCWEVLMTCTWADLTSRCRNGG